MTKHTHNSDKIPNVTRNDVIRVVQRDFAPDQFAVTLAMLDHYVGDTEAGAARVRLAALKLAAGSITRLQEFIDIANSDYRDVICPAEYPRFQAIGFVGIGRMTPDAVLKLKEDDWREYESWVYGAPTT